VKRIFTGAGGINTVDDPALAPFDKDTGASDLLYAADVNIEPTGRIGRRPGHALLFSGDYHSAYCDGGDAFTGRTTTIQQVLGDLSLRDIRSGLTGARISWSTVGEKTYYMNGTQQGVIRDGASSAWTMQTYVGPTTMDSFSGPPMGERICWHQARMYIASGDTLFRSEPFQPGLFALARNHWRLDAPIIMLVSVKSKTNSGLFISTTKKTYFFNTSGERPKLDEVAAYPALADSACLDKIEGLRLGLQPPGLCAFWLAKTGVCVGLPDGSMINMTESRVSLTGIDAGSGATLLRGPHLIGTYEGRTTLCTTLERGPITAKAVSQHSYCGFNSYCRSGDNYLAASSAGLYSIGGTTDAGVAIASSFAFMSDFGRPEPKWLRYLYFGHETTGNITVSTAVNEGSAVSSTVTYSAATQQSKRVPCGRGRRARYWTVSVANVSGSDFSVDTIDGEYTTSSRGVAA